MDADMYQEMLEDMECPACGHTGMDPNGTFEYECPNCGHEGSMI
jgi:rubrerythrin